MPRELVTLRLDSSVRRRLASVARREGRTPSDVARRALEAGLRQTEEAAGQAPHDALADLVGCVRGGDPGRSTRGGRAIADSLRKARRKSVRTHR